MFNKYGLKVYTLHLHWSQNYLHVQSHSPVYIMLFLFSFLWLNVMVCTVQVSLVLKDNDEGRGTLGPPSSHSFSSTLLGFPQIRIFLPDHPVHTPGSNNFSSTLRRWIHKLWIRVSFGASNSDPKNLVIFLQAPNFYHELLTKLA